MVLPEETVGDIDRKPKKARCSTCEEPMYIGVYKSAAGYYIGFFCTGCGPYSRESCYYDSREEAERHLDNGNYHR